MCPDLDIDMMGDDDEMMVLQIGFGHVIYTGGAKGTDEMVESWSRHFGMQVEVLVPPHHPRAQHITPSTVEVLVLANPHIHLAAQKLGKQVPRHHYTLQLLQRNYQIAKKAHTIFAFGTLHEDAKRVEGGKGWTVQMALNQGKQVYLFDIPRQIWFRSENYYEVNQGGLFTDSKFIPCSNPPQLHQSSAVVGSRKLDIRTCEEIGGLFHRTFCLPENAEERMEIQREIDQFQL